MPVTYRDADGGWDATIGMDGKMLFGALIEPSAAWRAQRDADVQADAAKVVIRVPKIEALITALAADPNISATTRAAITLLRG